MGWGFLSSEGELEEEDPSTVQEKEREAWEARKRELEVLVVGRPSPQQFKQQMSPRFASDLDPSLQGTAVDLETVLSKVAVLIRCCVFVDAPF